MIVASGGTPADQIPPWNETIAPIRTKHLGAERRAGSTTYSHPTESHAEVLGRSSFKNVDILEWTWVLQRDWTR